MHLKAQFKNFFERLNTFTLGICNGCQMLSGLKSIIPGAGLWPEFKENRSTQFEARVVMIEIEESNSLFLKDMQGAVLTVPVAHGQGRVESNEKCCIRFVDGNRVVADENSYPANPNGSIGGATGYFSDDGRCLIMMPHPERYIRSVTHTWKHKSRLEKEDECGGCLKIFQNARSWTEQWM